MRKLLTQVREGELTFENFVAQTRKDFFLLATNLLRRWKNPAWLTADDLEQELYLGAWKYIPKHDPTRGKPIEEYVLWNAMNAAKRELHVARGVSISGSPDRKASNFEAPLTSLGEEGDGEVIMNLMAEAPIAEEYILQVQQTRKTATAALKICETPKERMVVLAIREAGSLDKASSVLYDDMQHRIALRLDSEEYAERFVFRHAKVIAKKMQDARVTPG